MSKVEYLCKNRSLLEYKEAKNNHKVFCNFRNNHEFGYCSLFWILHSRRLNNKIYSIHERAPRITYQDNTSTFQELLNKCNPVSIHHENLQVCATEMFRIYRGLFPEVLTETFASKQVRIIFAETIPLRDVKCTLDITVLNRYRFTEIWDLVPVELKQAESLDSSN